MSEADLGAGPGARAAGRRFPLATPAAATVLGALALALAVASVVLSGLLHELSVLGSGPVIPIVVIYAAVGLLVARRQPGNPIGWILLLFVLLFTLSSTVGYYAVLSYRGHHPLPLAPVAVILQPAWAPAILLFPLAVLLFPDGRLGARRWRRVLWAYALLGCFAMAAMFAPAITAVARHDVRLDQFGDVTGQAHPAGPVLAAAEVIGVAAITVICLSFVGHQVLSWRRATGERRQQLKWLALGAGVTIVITGGSFAISSTSIAGELLGIGLAGLPAGIGVAILKYRLYEVDRLISRTLAYAVVTGLLVGIYAGLVLLATRVLGVATPVSVAASTLAAAALFTPLRRRVQRAVDRRFNRARYDADKTVAEFAARLQDAVDLDAVLADLSGVARRSLEPASVSVWLRPPG